MQNLVIAFYAIAPLFILMATGAALKRYYLLKEEILPQLNNLIFRVFLPLMLFYNIYRTSTKHTFQPRLIWFILLSILILYAILFFIVVKIEKEPGKRGVMIQALFRSNFLILGLPIVASIFGSENIGVTAITVACVVPLFNVLAVLTLESFRDGMVDGKKIAVGVLSNPLIWASGLGLMLSIAKITLPVVLDDAIGSLAGIATPLALVCLGASLHASQVRGNKRNLLICVIGRLIVIPAILIPLAIWFGFRDLELGTIMAVFASPTAVVSFVMAQQMGGDAELAGQAVVFSSLFSCLTIFLWTFLLKQMGVM